jgi:hypothetical protein
MYRSSTAVSAEADSIRSNVALTLSSFESSRALFGWKADLLEELFALERDHAEPDWDGYGAEPISSAALFRAKAFIRSLPESLATPELSVEPDGAISLDWMPSRAKTYSISIGDSDRLAYAWVDGTDKGHAVTRAVDGGIPGKLASHLTSFLTDAPSLRIA